jgi:hypothetical protein
MTEYNAIRVWEYECTVYYSSTGSSHTKQYTFTQNQADEVGAVLHPDGMPMWAARQLCEKWTRRGNHESIRYTYRIAFNTK